MKKQQRTKKHQLEKVKRMKKLELKHLRVVEPLIESVTIKTKDGKVYKNTSVEGAMKDIATTHNYKVGK